MGCHGQNISIKVNMTYYCSEEKRKIKKSSMQQPNNRPEYASGLRLAMEYVSDHTKLVLIKSFLDIGGSIKSRCHERGKPINGL
jgi:hypothetical protein